MRTLLAIAAAVAAVSVPAAAATIDLSTLNLAGSATLSGTAAAGTITSWPWALVIGIMPGCCMP